jgi:tRNA modification GTPase
MSRLLHDECIVAVASPSGAGARVVIRLSGRDAHKYTETIFQSAAGAPLSELRAFRRHAGQIQLNGPPSWPAVPAAAYLFKAPKSYTCENMVELHTIGSPPFVSALLRELQSAGARQAGPGEFTRRAFLNGRVDLTQAEAVLAMTSGEQRAQVRLAARTLRGGLREQIDAVKDGLIELTAYVEAGIDFSEDEIEIMPVDDACKRLEQNKAALQSLKDRAARFQIHLSEPVIALKGLANAGKSTLLNQLLGEERAITSDQAGTTRDVIGVRCLLGSLNVRLLDVAGDKESQNNIEAQALEQAQSALDDADLVVHLLAPPYPTQFPDTIAATEIRVYNKIDQLNPAEQQSLSGEVTISALHGEGVKKLKTLLEAQLRTLLGLEENLEARDFVASTRQLALIDESCQAIDQALFTMRNFGEERWELSMVDIRAALDALGEITGLVATDDILDAIFGRFCIGK